METLEGVMDRWIYDYKKHQRLILSFDFLFSHTSFLVVLVFYWVKLLTLHVNPLFSRKESAKARESRCFGMLRVLDIMRDYAYHRSRELSTLSSQFRK
jgi:hypothetical protein